MTEHRDGGSQDPETLFDLIDKPTGTKKRKPRKAKKKLRNRRK